MAETIVLHCAELCLSSDDEKFKCSENPGSSEACRCTCHTEAALQLTGSTGQQTELKPGTTRHTQKCSQSQSHSSTVQGLGTCNLCYYGACGGDGPSSKARTLSTLTNSRRKRAAVMAPPMRPPVFFMSAMGLFICSQYESSIGMRQIFSPVCARQTVPIL